jgi:hypothetical protein
MGITASDDELVLPDGAQLERADFSGRHLRYISIGSGSRLIECDFSGTRMNGGGLGGGYEPTEYDRCVFDGCHLKDVLPGRASFVECSFRNVRLDTFLCNDAEFVDCVFSGLLRGVVFSATPSSTERLGRVRNAYHGNDFTEAKLEDVSFRGGIDLGSQRLPIDSSHFVVRDAATVLAAVREKVRQWSEESLRDDAETTLWVLERIHETGQRDLFIERSILGRIQETANRLTTLLRGGPASGVEAR